MLRRMADLIYQKYYVHTKSPLPLDIEFLVLDTFALTRPQWKFVEDIEEATKSFQLAIAQDQKTAGVDKVVEADDATSGPSSEDENGDMDDVEGDGDGDDESASEEEEDAEVRIDTDLTNSHLTNSLANNIINRRVIMDLLTRANMTRLSLLPGKRKLLTLRTKQNLSESMPK